jgi:hypothetical protein
MPELTTEHLKDLIHGMFLECLDEAALEVETRCAGHMGPSELWLVLSFQGQKVKEWNLCRDASWLS